MKKRGILSFCKKGTISVRQSLIHLGMLVLAAAVLYFLLSYVKSIKESSDFEMLFFSRDIALLTNTIYSAPGDVDYTYSSNKLSTFNYDFKPTISTNDNVAINVKFEGTSKSYPYAKNSQSAEYYSIQIPKSIKFSKKDNTLIISKNE